jgi:hypothetical protein
LKGKDGFGWRQCSPGVGIGIPQPKKVSFEFAGQIFKLGPLINKGQLDDPSGSVALLPDNELDDPFILEILILVI